MTHENESKIKLLVLYDILCKMTDEDHALNSDEIIEELAKRNIKESRKVLTVDIAVLNSMCPECGRRLCKGEPGTKVEGPSWFVQQKV